MAGGGKAAAGGGAGGEHTPTTARSKKGRYDVEENYVFYGSYHHNAVNKAIHVVFVWPILFTALVLLHYTPPLLPSAWVPEAALSAWRVWVGSDAAFVVAAVYVLFYLRLEPKGGSVAALLVVAALFGATRVVRVLGADVAWKVALGVHVLSWVAQFLGHGVFEGRAPALLDNLRQAFLMAPYFVLLEVLSWCFSFEPLPGFWERVNRRVEENIQAFRKKKAE